MAVRKRAWMTRKGEQKTAWVVDYRDQSGKRHIETCVRKKDADAREAQVRINIKSGTHVAPSDSLTVAEAAQGWIKEVVARGREEGTLHQYRQHVRTHIVPRIGRVKLAKLTDATLSHFRDELLKALSRATARKVLTSTKMILKQAKFGHVAAAVSIERSKRERRLEAGIDFPDTGEIRRLIAAAPKPRQKALLLTVALTGLRASELRGLRWRDVDFKVGELHVRQRADLKNVIGAPKSRSSNRTVPLAARTGRGAARVEIEMPEAGQSRSGVPDYKRRDLAPCQHAAHARAGDVRRWRGRERDRQAEIRAARLPPLLRVVVHQPGGSRRTRPAAEGGSGLARALVHRHDHGRVWAPVPKQHRPQRTRQGVTPAAATTA
jgi:integrase